MRNNQPVTNDERKFGSSEQLISSTDLQGNIRHCNDAFVKISGYSRQELIGQPHNLVRHPDMPTQAFKVMWEHLKAGKPWMGLVKNRCKNGDYYWVNAYVTPVTERGQVIGYESVRTCPKREDVARAEHLYRSIRNNAARPNALINKIKNHFSSMFGLIAAILGIGLWVAGWPEVAVILLIAALIGVSIWHKLHMASSCKTILELIPNAFKHPLAVETYTQSSGVLGELTVAVLAQRAHLNTVLTRIDDAASQVFIGAKSSADLSHNVVAQLNRQQHETTQVATAMHQMTTTIAEVSRSVQSTADETQEADSLAQNGKQVASKTADVIRGLQRSVDNIANSVDALAQESKNISNAAVVIEQIAEQTNLLALNAAIEAARAGEQGRGFAVVADEVRQLAQRTTDSTKEIHRVIASLATVADEAVQSAANGRQDAESGVKQVLETAELLNGINTALNKVSDMSQQMAASVEEQATVAEDVNKQIVDISDLANISLAAGEEFAGQATEMQEVALGLHEVVKRFR
ncbi:methyl-accepting chemotaxis protein [Neptunicella marina]|uniref:Methyl-accepting chemotaxis protein n=1 Tax=Neptunicella marina TaxID=2125989 RepID=A0A8J6IV06_9ALTE|nr:PAS domain-containing methyl-accepting chemotaxis protein [Neptunicella marina]MBC3766003.1 methyl-accepting chemotaxis protein [Neptunicella marina]